MASFDLKPLTEDIIQELGLKGHALWKVKFGEEVFGLFDTPSLLHYAQENAELMEEAYACHSDQESWKEFYSYPEFKKVEKAHVAEIQHEVHYWVMENGVKSEMFTKEYIEKKIKSGTYSRATAISLDNGHTWREIHQMADFARHFKAHTGLPVAPPESSFQKAKSRVLDELEHKEEAPIKSALPNLAYIAQAKAKGVSLKVEELTLDTSEEVQVTKSMKWALPAVATAIAVAIIVGHQLSLKKQEDPLTADNDPIDSAVRKVTGSAARMNAGSAYVPPREPASYGRRSSLTQKPNFRDDVPTHIETHVDEYGPDLSPRESAENDIPQAPEATQEPSLVDNGAPAEEQSLDAAMNVSQAPAPTDAPMDQPEVIQEAPAELPEPAQDI